jgi:hypothetical protein
VKRAPITQVEIDQALADALARVGGSVVQDSASSSSLTSRPIEPRTVPSARLINVDSPNATTTPSAIHIEMGMLTLSAPTLCSGAPLEVVRTEMT